MKLNNVFCETTSEKHKTKTKMIKKTIAILTLFLTTYSFSQVQLCLGEDATVCQGQTVTITNCNPSGGNTNANGITLTNPTILSLSDDVWSGVVPVGFNFSYYGNTYTNCIIGSNGLISFNTGSAGGYCAWALNGGATIPTTGLAASLNSIMLTYQDILPSLNGGTIQYQTIGTAPNRKFIVLYQNVYFFSCTSVCNYMAVVLSETSNEIEMFIGNKPTCGQFNGGLAIQGIQNATGTAAVATPGRNNTVWTANQDGRKFTPASPTNTTSYQHSQIPYIQINGVNGSTQWGNTAGATFPFNNGVLNVNLIPPGTTGYFLTGSACGAALGAVSDTTWITRSNINATGSSVTDFCSTGVGSASIVNPTGNAPFAYLWTPGGQTTQTATNLVGGNYSCLVTNANGCTKTVNVTVQNNVSTASAVSTLVSCPGGNDGTATATMTPTSPNLTYNWYDAGGQTTATAVGLSAGTYHCVVSTGGGCVDTAVVTVTEIPGMIATVTAQTDVTCNSGSDGSITVNVTQGTAPYTYSWDNSTSTTNVANDLAVGAHIVTITDALGCVTTQTATLAEPTPLTVSFISPDVTICPEATTTLTATGSGGSSAYSYEWTSNGVTVGTEQTITVDPENSGTQYCVTVTEACGSPEATACMLVSFPTEIIPNIVPDKLTDCQPALFTYTNNSNNGQEIATTHFYFGNSKDSLVQGNGPAFSLYEDAQKYTVDVVITSIYGCVYSKSFPNIVEAIAIPTASFTFSSNPTTIFETVVQMQDNSSEGVNSWEWKAVDASPMTSTNQNPIFTFPEGYVGNYPVQLIVTTPEGCTDTVEYILTVNSDVIFYAPNVFTPDNDEHNQTWEFHVDGIDIYNFRLQIFNRWGELVWETLDPSQSWDGTYNGSIVQDGIYTWTASVKDANTDNKQTFGGFITIIR